MKPNSLKTYIYSKHCTLLYARFLDDTNKIPTVLQ